MSVGDDLLGEFATVTSSHWFVSLTRQENDNRLLQRIQQMKDTAEEASKKIEAMDLKYSKSAMMQRTRAAETERLNGKISEAVDERRAAGNRVQLREALTGLSRSLLLLLSVRAMKHAHRKHQFPLPQRSASEKVCFHRQTEKRRRSQPIKPEELIPG